MHEKDGKRQYNEFKESESEALAVSSGEPVDSPAFVDTDFDLDDNTLAQDDSEDDRGAVSRDTYFKRFAPLSAVLLMTGIVCIQLLPDALGLNSKDQTLLLVVIFITFGMGIGTFERAREGRVTQKAVLVFLVKWLVLALSIFAGLKLAGL